MKKFAMSKGFAVRALDSRLLKISKGADDPPPPPPDGPGHSGLISWV